MPPFPHSAAKGPESERTEDTQGTAAFQPGPLTAARVTLVLLAVGVYCSVYLVLESMVSWLSVGHFRFKNMNGVKLFMGCCLCKCPLPTFSAPTEFELAALSATSAGKSGYTWTCEDRLQSSLGF